MKKECEQLLTLVQLCEFVARLTQKSSHVLLGYNMTPDAQAFVNILADWKDFFPI